MNASSVRSLEPQVAATADTTLAERVERRLAARLGDRIRGLRVVVKGNRIRLSGECRTYHCKQLAQHAAIGFIEDATLDNDIRVASRD